MKEWRGLWLPDGEKHLTDWMQNHNVIVDGKPAYQYNKIQAALLLVENFGTAIDVGAHCGLWSMHLHKFANIHAFEPVADHRECFAMNCPGVPVYPYALGSESKMVSIETTEGSSGNSYVTEGNTVEMRTLDSFGLKCDFMKIDCEGYELDVLKGATETLGKVVIVEQKHERYGNKTAAVDFLKDLGYTLRQVINGDYLLLR